jgi:Sulfotransferase domain
VNLRKPDLFIVGAPKCGTTAMSHYLELHPDIYMARKEMHYFGSDLHFARQFYRRNLEAYLAEFSQDHGRRLAGDASVWYLYSTQAAAEIKAFNPDARIIIMLREPAEMLYSLYYQFRFDGNEHLPTFEQALAAEDERREGRGLGRQAYLAQGLLYRETARYTDQVRRYFEVFGSDRVHVIIYDDFAANVPAEYRRVLEFLGVGSTRIKAEFEEVNSNKYVRNQALQSAMGDPLLRSAVLAVRPWLPRPVFGAAQKVDALLRKLNTRHAVRPPIATGLRRQLKAEFAREVESLGELIGRDLTHWNREDGRRQNDSQALPRASVRVVSAGVYS